MLSLLKPNSSVPLSLLPVKKIRPVTMSPPFVSTAPPLIPETVYVPTCLNGTLTVPVTLIPVLVVANLATFHSKVLLLRLIES